jgi:hypothetical protein
MKLNCATGRTRSCAALLGLILISSLAAAPKDKRIVPPPEATAGAGEYVSFTLISERNIFNANRSARSGRGGDEDRKVSQVDTFTLVGTLTYEKGPYAFFDGSSPDYSKVLEPGKSIAGYKIAAVEGNAVKLESGTNTVELSVGMKMRREEEGEWQVVSSGQPANVSSSPSTGSSDSAAGEESDIVKRLMQQREQELK